MFSKDTKLGEVIEKEDILKEHGVPCVSCPMAKFELESLTLGQICENYGVDLDDLLDDLNKNE